MTSFRPAEVFPPGEILREELEARGWTQEDFAEIIGKHTPMVNEVLAGKRSITPETARAFSEALGTSAEFWMNLETSYRLSRVDATAEASDISRRALLYTFPIRAMGRRGWIDDSSNLDVLEHQLISFFCVESLEEIPHLAHPAKKTGQTELTPLQLAWLYRAKQLAEVLKVPRFSESKLRDALRTLRSFLPHPEQIMEVSRILADTGVRYVLVEGLSGSKIDGVCFWLNRHSPVVAMSLRCDRIDNYWFVLRHELEHVLRGDAKGTEITEVELDSDFEGAGVLPSVDMPEEERQANQAAADFCVPQQELDDFIARIGPVYSRTLVVNFANRIEVHPGLVVGQLQNRGELPYSHLRKLLVRVQQFVTEPTLTDGWGHMPQLQPVRG